MPKLGDRITVRLRVTHGTEGTQREQWQYRHAIHTNYAAIGQNWKGRSTQGVVYMCDKSRLFKRTESVTRDNCKEEHFTVEC
jgi:hypothetical protein